MYQYFPSTGALVAAVVEDAFPRATAELVDAVAGANTPASRLDAYVSTALRLSADPAYRALATLASADLPAECRERLRELHAEQVAPLQSALRDSGVSDPGLSAALILGVLHAAAQAMVSGAPRARVERTARALIANGVVAGAGA